MSGFFVTDAAHRAVVLAHGVVVARHAHAEVALVLAQFIGHGGVVAQPGEFQAEGALPVAQVDQREPSVGGLFAARFPQPEGLVVEGDAAVEVRYVDVEMVETTLDFHDSGVFVRYKSNF